MLHLEKKLMWVGGKKLPAGFKLKSKPDVVANRTESEGESDHARGATDVPGKQLEEEFIAKAHALQGSSVLLSKAHLRTLLQYIIQRLQNSPEVASTEKKRGAGGPKAKSRRGAGSERSALRAASGEPKKPKNAFLFFTMEQRSKEKENPTGMPMFATLGEQWRKMDEAQRQPYKEKQEEDKVRYEREIAAFKAAGKETAREKERRDKGLAKSPPNNRKSNGERDTAAAATGGARSDSPPNVEELD